MDLTQILRELHEGRARVDGAILALERATAGRGRTAHKPRRLANAVRRIHLVTPGEKWGKIGPESDRLTADGM